MARRSSTPSPYTLRSTVCANASRSVAVFRHRQYVSPSPYSCLLARHRGRSCSDKFFSWATLASFFRSPRPPVDAGLGVSSARQTRSASCAPAPVRDKPCGAGRSAASRRFGEKMPGVSPRMIWVLFSITIPRISALGGLHLARNAGDPWSRRSALTQLWDLPELGGADHVDKAAARVRRAHYCAILLVIAAAGDRAFALRSSAEALRFSALACCRRRPSAGRQPRQNPPRRELRVCDAARYVDLAIPGRQALALRPFPLQHRLGIAQAGRTRPLLLRSVPVLSTKSPQSRIAAVRTHRPRRSPPRRYRRARICAGSLAHHHRRRPRPILMSSVSPSYFATVGAALLAHESRVRFDISHCPFGKVR